MTSPDVGARDSVRSGPAEAAEARIGVLHVVLTYTPGGGERAAIDIATRLASRFRIVACCLDAPGPWAHQLTERGIDVIPLNRRPGFHPALGWRIARLAKAQDVRVLHCHQYSPYVYGSLAALSRPGLRVVVTEQGRLSDSPPSRRRRLANSVLGRIPSRVFAVSSELRVHLIREGFPADRVEVLYNSIDVGPGVSVDERLRTRAALGIPGACHVVGSVARLDPVKDLGTLIRAFALFRRSVPDAILVLVGDGPERGLLERVAAQEGVADTVRFMGSRDDARRILGAFDQYVNCSVTEGTSLTIMEAMAASLPVVATNVGGTPEIVLDGSTGVLVPRQDPQALAGAILGLATKPSRARELGAAGRRRVEEQFSVDRMVDRYAEAYVG